MLVAVPLQRRLLPGLVMSLTAAPSVPEPRPIREPLDPEPVLNETQLAVARWMARTTLAPLHRCVLTMLPPHLRPRASVRLIPLTQTLPEGLAAPAEALMRLLITRGPLEKAQVARALPGVDWRRGRRILQAQGYIRAERFLYLPRVQPRHVRKVTLLLPRAAWAERMTRLRRRNLYKAVLHLLEQEGKPLEVSIVHAETGATTAHLRTLARRGLIAFSEEIVIRDPLADQLFTPEKPPALTPGQAAVWREVAAQLHADAPPPPILLLGVTGSGKTEIYLRATAEVLAQGRQALILVPEISLTPQTVRRFAVRFTGQVGLWHSGMTEGERFDTWRRIRNGSLPVVVGARSALFLPFPSLGLIVLDEEEDGSYKQTRQPYYHAREVAEELARRYRAALILGSATPSLEAYARAQGGRYRLLVMPHRVMGHRRRLEDWRHLLHLRGMRYRPLTDEACTIALPPVRVVDMRAELKAGNRSIFSLPLQQAVDRALARGEQIILFLNRRGTATHIFCRDCAWVARCPRCDIPLIYHADADALICHHCAYQTPMPRRCPACGSPRVRAFGLGTEGLERRTRERWPKAAVLRWDRDVARSHAAHVAMMTRFAQGDADILVGTQMIARGLDLPKVTVVGIVSADTGLHLPDFRAAERTFQLLTQVAGRAGRGLLGGQVILQTYHPNHYAIRRAAAHDYLGFARQEMSFRKRTGYPPAVRLARLLYRHRNNEQAQAAAETLAEILRRRLTEAGLPPTDLIGPAPAFFARIRGTYRWQLLLRSVDPAAFLRDVPLPPGWIVDVDPVNVL